MIYTPTAHQLLKLLKYDKKTEKEKHFYFTVIRKKEYKNHNIIHWYT